MSEEIREIAICLCEKNRAWAELHDQRWELVGEKHVLESNLRMKIKTLDEADDIVAECLKIATIKRRIEQIESEVSRLDRESSRLYQAAREYEQQLDEATVALAVV